MQRPHINRELKFLEHSFEMFGRTQGTVSSPGLQRGKCLFRETRVRTEKAAELVPGQTELLMQGCSSVVALLQHSQGPGFDSQALTQISIKQYQEQLQGLQTA